MVKWVVSKICQFGNTDRLIIDTDGTMYCLTFRTFAKISQDLVWEQIALKGSDKFFDMVWDGNNTIFISAIEERQIFCYKIDTGESFVLAGCPRKDQYTDGPLAECAFKMPLCLALDNNGNLFVFDQGVGLRKIDLKTQLITTVVVEPKMRCAGMIVGENSQMYLGLYYPCITCIIGVAPDVGIYHLQEDKLCRVDVPLCPMRSLFLYNENTLLWKTRDEIHMFDIRTSNLTKSNILKTFWISGIAANGSLYLSDSSNLYLAETTWKYEKYLWLGHLKGNAKDCYLAKLPRDIIREICSQLCLLILDM